jgi:cell division protein ZapE
LYPNGIQRELFLPAIALLNEKLDVIEVDSGIDYRLRSLEQAEVFLIAPGADTIEKMERVFKQIAGGEGHSRPVEVMGRQLDVLQRAPGVIWFNFDTLCSGHRSQNDYLWIADYHHTVFLSNVPKLKADQASAARRFTWLIDVLYDHRVKLLMSAECDVDQIYTEGLQSSEFKRTESRLIEMQSHEYLASAHRRESHPVSTEKSA